MANIEVQLDFSASAETVWKWVGSTGDVASWIPAIDSSHMEGDVRHVVFTDGELARERIVEYADDTRMYVYEYIDGPLPLRHYRSTVSVVETGNTTCTVHWTAEFGATSSEAEADLAEAIKGIYSDALDELEGKVTSV